MHDHQRPGIFKIARHFLPLSLLKTTPDRYLIYLCTGAFDPVCRKVPVRITDGNGYDDFFRWRYAQMLSEDIRIVDPLAFDAGVEAVVHRRQADGLGNHADVKQRPPSLTIDRRR